jgi:hypothetical protein
VVEKCESDIRAFRQESQLRNHYFLLDLLDRLRRPRLNLPLAQLEVPPGQLDSVSLSLRCDKVLNVDAGT